MIFDPCFYAAHTFWVVLLHDRGESTLHTLHCLSVELSYGMVPHVVFAKPVPFRDFSVVVGNTFGKLQNLYH